MLAAKASGHSGHNFIHGDFLKELLPPTMPDDLAARCVQHRSLADKKSVFVFLHKGACGVLFVRPFPPVPGITMDIIPDGRKEVPGEVIVFEDHAACVYIGVLRHQWITRENAVLLRAASQNIHERLEAGFIPYKGIGIEEGHNIDFGILLHEIQQNPDLAPGYMAIPIMPWLDEDLRILAVHC